MKNDISDTLYLVYDVNFDDYSYFAARWQLLSVLFFLIDHDMNYDCAICIKNFLHCIYFNKIQNIKSISKYLFNELNLYLLLI